MLSDTSKFKKLTKDPTTSLKQRANKLITQLNSTPNCMKIDKLIGDFKPGYIYGNVKTHKPNNPLRPIISQCPTPTYNLAKTIHRIIEPFIPNQYTLKSTNDFIDLLRSNPSRGILASLDVESLFTNVPIEATIEIIIAHVYHHTTLPPPAIPENILKEFLSLCTKESPFISPSGDLFCQIEGVAMGSPLSPVFANFYMGDLETRLFNDQSIKPHLYARFVDDIFLQINDTDSVIRLKELFENNSVLNFTYELNVNSKLPFLDILVTSTNQGFHTTVYKKPTDKGMCLNADSECTELYKKSVITNYIHRIFKATSTWHDFHTQINVMKQSLVNNNYSNTSIDFEIQKFLNKVHSPGEPRNGTTDISIFYLNQMHRNYKLDERIIKEIITNNVVTANNSNRLKFIIYYQNKRASNLVMCNNPNPKPPTLQQSGLVYMFKCALPHSKVESYIGLTQAKLSDRLIAHTYNGAIRQHFIDHHGTAPSRPQLTDNTSILMKAPDRYRLLIKEALLISKFSPSINRQYNDFNNTLKLFNNTSRTRHNAPLSQDNRPGTHNPPATPPRTDSEVPHPSTPEVIPQAHGSSLTANNDFDVNSAISPDIQQRITRLIQNSRPGTPLDSSPPSLSLTNRSGDNTARRLRPLLHRRSVSPASLHML